MTESLFLRYRPKTFPEIVGQRLSAVALSKMVELNRVPQGLLFSGPSGSGKTTAARVLASSLHTESVSVVEIDAASNRGVDHIKTLINTLRYGSGGHVIILDEAHNLTNEAFNTLLKTLEEPAQGTVFMLLTTEPGIIPETVKSRLMEFEFRKISESDTLNRLFYVCEREQFDVNDALLRLIATESRGNLRSALISLEFVTLSGIDSVDDYLEVNGKTDFAPNLLELMTIGNYDSILTELDAVLSIVSSPKDISISLLDLCSDLLRLRAGGPLPFEGTALDIRKRLSVEISREELLSAVKLIWDLRTKTRSSEDPRGSLEMTVILMSDILSRSKRVSSPSVIESRRTPSPTGEKAKDTSKVTLSDMRTS